MKVGIITSAQEEYTVRLLYFLKNSPAKPDLIILVRKSLSARILENLSLRAVISFLKERYLNSRKENNTPHIDHLGRFLKERGISIPEISLGQACRKEGVTLLRVSELRSEKTLKRIRKTNTDLLINAGGGIFRPGIINAINIGILNAHMGFLPDFRGMNVLEWSLFYGKTIGVTMHLIDRGIDTGDILFFREIPIEQGDTIDDLRNKSAIANFLLFADAVAGFSAGNIRRKSQSPESGKQYFVMHPRLKSCVERKLSALDHAQEKNEVMDIPVV
jgi:folate-dependent phosphoribosylglycinamide formyltransferase PurN